MSCRECRDFALPHLTVCRRLAWRMGWLMWIDVGLVLQVAAVCDELLGSGYCRVSG